MKFFILACSVCFGDPSSASSKGMVLAILFLMGVIGSVLAAVMVTILVWTHRARKQASMSPS